MAKYRKKPVLVNAWKVADLLYSANRDWSALPDRIVQAYNSSEVVFGDVFISVTTMEGRMRAASTDMLIEGVKSELYPCKPDIFEATYEPATPQEDK